MGKRKLHGQFYYQCDWTGFPMQSANCFMPSWTNENKMIKKGSYCNWESVLAHAQHLFDANELEASDFAQVTHYVKCQMGDIVHSTTAPHFTDCEHIKHEGSQNLNAQQYHRACCYQTDEIFAVKIDEAGQPFEVLLDPNDGVFNIAKHIKSPGGWDTPPSMFQSYRKGKHKEKELCVFYYPSTGRASGNGLEFNSLASSLFKMQIYGQVLLLQCTKEASFLPRERFVNYTLSEFQDNFVRKRKRAAQEPQSFGTVEYGEIKAEMQASLSDYERQASLAAKAPEAVAKAMKMPATSGRELARLVKQQRLEERLTQPRLVTAEA